MSGQLNQKGSIILLAMLMAGLVAIVGFTLAEWQTQTVHVQKQQKIKSAAATIQQKILNQIYNNESWVATAAGDTCLQSGSNCGAGANGRLTLRNSDNTIFYDSSVDTSGFNFFGEVCNSAVGESFLDSGNDTCPFRYDLRWSAVNCIGAKCQIQINGLFKYAPLSLQNKYPFSITKWSLNFVKGLETGSLQSACISIGGYFDQATSNCIPSNNQVSQCADGYVFKSVDSTQVPVCTSIKKVGSCPAGQVARGIASDGNLDCMDPAAQTQHCVFSHSEITGACICNNGSCTQSIVLVWNYANTTTVCNQSTALQICGGI